MSGALNGHTNFNNGVRNRVLAANYTLAAADPFIIRFDPAAARDLTIPDDLPSGGLRMFVNCANAAEVMTIKDEAGNTLGTIAQNQTGVYAMAEDASGWIEVFKFTTTAQVPAEDT